MPNACWGRRLLVVTVSLVLLLAACTGDDDAAEESTTSTTEETTATSAIDYTQVSLAPVEGSTTTTVALGPGSATLQGIVAGPDGPVSGATVRVERVVGDGVAAVDILTGEDGGWVLEEVLGGRFRIRAWLAPDLAMVAPEIFFLEAGDQRTVDLRVEVFSGMVVRVATDPDPPVVGSPTNLGIRLMNRLVDEEGTVRGFPLAGVDVDLRGSGRWQLHTDQQVTTDSTGNAAWSLTCRASGPQPLSIVLDGGDSRPLDLSDCVAPEPPSTTTTDTSDPSATTTTSSTTSSTSSTTTTTQAD